MGPARSSFHLAGNCPVIHPVDAASRREPESGPVLFDVSLLSVLSYLIRLSQSVFNPFNYHREKCLLKKETLTMDILQALGALALSPRFTYCGSSLTVTASETRPFLGATQLS